MPTPPLTPLTPADPARVTAYWDEVAPAPGPEPDSWAFGDHAQLADELLALVLDGTKTATAGALADYEGHDELLPEPGDLGIVLDGSGEPRALLRVTHVEVRPFSEVDAEHAWLEGEGDRSLEHWREGHERFFARASVDGFDPAMPIVLERFVVLHPPGVSARSTTT